MTENLTWQEIHTLIRTMIQKMETHGTVTRTISRINYSELLGVLCNFTIFQYQKDIQLKIDCQDEIIIIQMINKESIDKCTGQKLDQKRTIIRLNKYENELREVKNGDSNG